MRGIAIPLIGLFVIGSLAQGCKRTPEDVEKWRNAKRGVEKMTKWAKSSEEPMDVRKTSLEFLIKDGHSTKISDIMKAVESDETKKKLVDHAASTVQEMWDSGEVPKLGDKKGGNVKRKEGWQPVERAKDAAYYLQPHAKGETKKKIESLLAEWFSQDWELRKELGKTDLSQLYARTGGKASEHVLSWLEKTGKPHEVAAIIRKNADDATKKKAAETLTKKAKEQHPNLSSSLMSAIVRFDHEGIVPYLKMAIKDEKTPPKLIDQSMEALKKVEGPTATPFFSKLIETRKGKLRWAAVNDLIDLRGKSGVLTAATALPIERDGYADEEGKFKGDAQFFANFVTGKIEDSDGENWSGTLINMLESDRWTVQVLGLLTVQAANEKELLGDDKTKILKAVKTLTSKRTSVPNWGEEKRVGEIAHDVANKLES